MVSWTKKGGSGGDEMDPVLILKGMPTEFSESGRVREKSELRMTQPFLT